MGLFGGLKDAKVTGGGVYFLPGLYEIEVMGVKMQRSVQNGRDMFIVECKILTSDNASRKPGSSASQIIKMGEQMSFPNIKAFLAGVVGVDPTQDADDVNEQIEAAFSESLGAQMGIEDIAEFVTSKDNPLEGTKLRLECVNVKTKKGTDFTKHKWLQA